MLPPKHDTFCWVTRLVLIPVAGCVMVTARVVVQPFASVMVQVNVPAGSAVAEAVV